MNTLYEELMREEMHPASLNEGMILAGARKKTYPQGAVCGALPIVEELHLESSPKILVPTST